MSRPPAQRLIVLLAAFSSQTDLSIGCFCEDQQHCHRSLLGELLVQAGAVMG